MSNLWKFSLGLGLILMFGANSPAVDYVLVPYVAGLGGVLFIYGVYGMLKSKSAKKREEAERLAKKIEEEKQKQEKEEMLRQAKADLLARKKAEEAERFRKEVFPVAGVTFKNDDGSDRQKILKEIVLNQYGSCEVWFEEDEELGDESGIKVITEFGCVGFIRRSDKAKIRKFFNKKTNTLGLYAELFESDDGEKIYRADVIIGMDKTDPEQAWYFES